MASTEPITLTVTVDTTTVTVEALPNQVSPGKHYLIQTARGEALIGFTMHDDTRPAERRWAMYGFEGTNGPEYGAGRATLSEAIETLTRRWVRERRKG